MSQRQRRTSRFDECRGLDADIYAFCLLSPGTGQRRTKEARQTAMDCTGGRAGKNQPSVAAAASKPAKGSE